MTAVAVYGPKGNMSRGRLIDAWLREPDLRVVDDASVSAARQRAREVASAQALGIEEAGRLALIASELAQNQLRHGRGGRMAVRPIARGTHRGVEIIAADHGAGIADPTVAIAGIPRAAGSLGVGLAAVREQATEVDFDVRIGEGSCIRARVFAPDVPRRRQLGIFGRAVPGEPQSGDHAGFHRLDDELVLGICDGLGHGPWAHEAACAAIDVFGRLPDASPTQILDECQEALGATRGAVMAVGRLKETDGTIELACVGNITIEAVAPRTRRRFGGASFVLGAPQARVRVPVERANLPSGTALVMFTDGVVSRASIEEDLALLREHPIIIAHQLVERFGRDGDDALALVVR
jgi:anti-sigma regulatory factor (Ser/Thr protein kinase)